MGCGTSRRICKIQKSTVIEVLSEEEYKNDPEDVKTARFWLDGQEMKIHFRKMNGRSSSHA